MTLMKTDFPAVAESQLASVRSIAEAGADRLHTTIAARTSFRCMVIVDQLQATRRKFWMIVVHGLRKD